MRSVPDSSFATTVATLFPFASTTSCPSVAVLATVAIEAILASASINCCLATVAESASTANSVIRLFASANRAFCSCTCCSNTLLCAEADFDSSLFFAISAFSVAISACKSAICLLRVAICVALVSTGAATGEYEVAVPLEGLEDPADDVKSEPDVAVDTEGSYGVKVPPLPP